MDDALTPEVIEHRLVAARPRLVAALLRYFRDLDLAEEGFQDACLRPLRSWPVNGPPRDAEGWLILVGRNAGVDQLRKRARLVSDIARVFLVGARAMEQRIPAQGADRRRGCAVRDAGRCPAR